MKRIMKDYFTFSKKERTAVIVLLCLVAFFMSVPYFYSPKIKPPVINKALADYLAQNRTIAADSNTKRNMVFRESLAAKETLRKTETFPFDPNTVNEADWKRLGISDKTIRTIFNYRNKGGKFRTAEDIRKVWGFKKEDADRLIPFINIVSAIPAPANASKPSFTKSTPFQPEKTVEIDINTATPEQWKSLPGIGEVLAARIIKYREHAGGFISADQIKKTYGLSDSTFQLILPFLKVKPETLPKLDINKASAYDLRMRLNVPENIARAIIVYRRQNGDFQSVEDLKKLVLITDSLFVRIVPRIEVRVQP